MSVYDDIQRDNAVRAADRKLAEAEHLKIQSTASDKALAVQMAKPVYVEPENGASKKAWDKRKASWAHIKVLQTASL